MPTINTTDTTSKLASFCRFSLAARSSRFAFTDHWPLATGHFVLAFFFCRAISSLCIHFALHSLANHAPRTTPHGPRRGQRGQVVRRLFPAGNCHPPTTELAKTERGPARSRRAVRLYSVCHRTRRSHPRNQSFLPQTSPPNRWAEGPPTFRHKENSSLQMA